MKTLATIGLSLIAIIASLVLILSSICVFGGGIGGGDRPTFLLYALIALAVVVAAMSAIAKLNRKP